MRGKDLIKGIIKEDFDLISKGLESLSNVEIMRLVCSCISYLVICRRAPKKEVIKSVNRALGYSEHNDESLEKIRKFISKMNN